MGCLHGIEPKTAQTTKCQQISNVNDKNVFLFTIWAARLNGSKSHDGDFRGFKFRQAYKLWHLLNSKSDF